jgi:hypothetical protein
LILELHKPAKSCRRENGTTVVLYPGMCAEATPGLHADHQAGRYPPPPEQPQNDQRADQAAIVRRQHGEEALDHPPEPDRGRARLGGGDAARRPVPPPGDADHGLDVVAANQARQWDIGGQDLDREENAVAKANLAGRWQRERLPNCCPGPDHRQECGH